VPDTTHPGLVEEDAGPQTPYMSDARPKRSPEQIARNNRIVLAVCVVFFLLLGAGIAAYAVNSYRDYHVRTTPPGGETTVVVVDEVTEGTFCSSNGKSSNCSPEYTLSYVVDGEQHETKVRDHLQVGDEVHAFEGTDGRWYVTEDPGFGNSEYAWAIWAALAAATAIFGLVCLRAWRKSPKPS